MNAGCVGNLRRVKHAISVARKILENTQHTLMVGDQVTNFAVQMGFREESLSTNDSIHVWEQWKRNYCQPNFWMVSVCCYIRLWICVIPNELSVASVNFTNEFISVLFVEVF